ncbi:MAG: hypothetical protein U1E65_24690 [Myxococcota bacterium]
MIFFLLWLFGPFDAVPEGAVSRFAPCRRGLSIAYEERRGDALVFSMEEEVIGPGAEPRTCRLLRRSAKTGQKPRSEEWAIEHLPDRIANAGWVSTPTAFRPPMLMAPIAVGTHWHFNRSDFRVIGVGERVQLKAGVFDDTVRVEERASDGSAFRSERVYAAGIGLVLVTQDQTRLEAVSVRVP